MIKQTTDKTDKKNDTCPSQMARCEETRTEPKLKITDSTSWSKQKLMNAQVKNIKEKAKWSNKQQTKNDTCPSQMII